MLVLTRKLEEQIRIGDDITISILRVKGNTVRVGIDAPRAIRVVRGELPTHEQGDPSSDSTPSPSPVSVEADLTETATAEESALPGEQAKPDPATTAVRQFIASRARRQDRRTQSPRPGNRSLAAALTRSA